MTTLAIILMTLAYLASMAAMTGYALRQSRRNMQLTRDKNDWRDHSRMLARRATRAEMLLEMAENRADLLEDERDGLVAELGMRKAKAS